MSIKALVLVCCVLVLFTPDAQGRSCVCVPVCGLECDFYGNCRVSCGLLCRCDRSKRDVPEGQPGANDIFSVQRGAQRFPIPLPYKFSDYDKNNNGGISLDELKQTLPPVNDTERIEEIFKFLDKDGDKSIDCVEFLEGKIDTDGKELVCPKVN